MSTGIATSSLLPSSAPRRHLWTAAEDEALRVAYQTRQRSEDIAQALGVPVSSVWSRANRLRLPRKKRCDAGSADVQRSCECCGAPFVILKGQASARPFRYCSVQCAGYGARSKLYAGIIEDNSIPEPNSGCWLWTGALTGDGYGAITVSGKFWLGHRLSYVLARGGPPAFQPVIRHLCNNPACVNSDHLSAGTTYDNAQDRITAGNQARGSQIYNAKLTEAWIPGIVAQHRAGASAGRIAEKYGVSQRAIDFVVRGVTWKHASGL